MVFPTAHPLHQDPWEGRSREESLSVESKGTFETNCLDRSIPSLEIPSLVCRDLHSVPPLPTSGGLTYESGKVGSRS